MKPLVKLVFAAALAASISAQNSNDNAPTATNALAFDKDTKVTVSYASFTTAGGNWLHQLYAKGDNGARARKFYNEQYVTGKLAGSLELSKDIELAGNPLVAGTYKFTFRIDEDLVWQMVVMNGKGQEVCVATMNTERDDKHPVSRLTITPVAGPEGKAGNLNIRFGPLAADIAFKVAASAAKKAEPAGKK
ncbi:MAG: hypothetical protein R3F56_11275 [Planctomycetota bacterium]